MTGNREGETMTDKPSPTGIRSILVPLEESDALPSVLRCALIAARDFNAYIEGLCVRPTLSGAIAVGFEGGAAALSGTEEQFEREQAARATRLREQFDRFVADNNLPRYSGDGVPTEACAGWVEDEAPGISVFGQRARLFEVTVVGRPTPGALTPAMNTLETVLFESGRSILIAPPKPPTTERFRRIAIAWNGATETAHTIAASMPFLRRADEIIVLSVEGAMVPGPSGDDISTALRRHGVAVVSKPVPGKRTPNQAGEVMLQEAAAWNADLLVKGGYTNSRLRQMIFGGATSHILANAELPVLMAH
jgi:nucleotide-binding universal stress UspA family protein